MGGNTVEHCLHLKPTIIFSFGNSSSQDVIILFHSILHYFVWSQFKIR